MNTRSLAQEATAWYQKHLDPQTPHATNIEKNFKGPVLTLTLRLLMDGQTTKETDWLWDEKAYRDLQSRHRARLDAFIQGCTLAVPDDPCRGRDSATPPPTFHRGSSPILTSIQGAVSRSKSTIFYPQIRSGELVLRLEIYLRSIIRSKQSSYAWESTKILKARAASIVRAFVATVSCVKSMRPTLTSLLQAASQEILCVEKLSEQVGTLIRRVVSEYEHQVSFASLAFLSSPEVSAEHRLSPLINSYLQYLQQNLESLVKECETEQRLAIILDPRMRHVFKTIEFQSIGHLLDVCHGFEYELSHIEVPPDNTATDNLKQALADLQREVLTVNGQPLPPVRSRKELLQVLSQTLNSRSLFRKFRESREEYGLGRGSSHCRRGFHLSAIDGMTRRLLLAAGRTGSGGDAYFIVRDLFGGDEVQVVPRPADRNSLELVVRLSSISILCHATFDVYPKSLMEVCEPLIQLHTTTTEIIYLQEVRASDSDDGMGKVDNDDDSDDEEEDGRQLILQEKQTDKTGWKTVSIRPALYEKVVSWSTPS